MAENNEQGQATEGEAPVAEKEVGIFDLEAPETEPDITFVEDGEILDFDEEEDESEDDITAEEDGDEDVVEEDDEEEVAEEGDEDVESEEATETEAEDEEQAQPEAEEDGEELTADAEEAATEPPVESAPTKPATEPLQFKADGREFTVNGRKDEDGNFVIAPEEWNRTIGPRLADRGAWAQEREAYRRQIDALAPDKNPEVVRARKITESFKELLDKGPDAVIEWAENYEANKEVLIAKAEAEAAKAEAAQYREGRAQETERQSMEQLTAQMDQGIDGVLEQAAQMDEYKGLDMEYVKRILRPMKGAIFFRAPRDMPEYGLSEGEIGINLQVVDNVLKAEAERTAAYQAQLNAQQKARAAKKRNEKILKTEKKAPPVETAKATAGQDTRPVKPAKSQDEWERNLRKIAR